MSEPTKEQIEKCRIWAKLAEHDGDPEASAAIRALLDAYEEIERLRAELGADNARMRADLEAAVDAACIRGDAPLEDKAHLLADQIKRIDAEVERLRDESMHWQKRLDEELQKKIILRNAKRQAEERLAKFLRYVQDHNFKPARDWACAECGDNPIVKPRFRCTWHECLAAAAQPEEKTQAAVNAHDSTVNEVRARFAISHPDDCPCVMCDPMQVRLDQQMRAAQPEEKK